MQKSLLKGASFILLSEFFFVLMGTQIREVSTHLSNEMIVFFRNLIGVQIIIPLLMKYGWSSIKTDKPRLHLLRGLAGVTAMYCFFYAIANLPLANAMILKMSAPLFIPIIAFIWLKETLNWLIGFVVLSVLRQGCINGFSVIVVFRNKAQYAGNGLSPCQVL